MEVLIRVLIPLGTMLVAIHAFIGESIVNMGNTQIRGQTISFRGVKVSQFLGIPYAETPVFDLRFSKPKPKPIYPNVILAYDNPASCWQAAEFPFPMFDTGSKSEDCLYLNIWAPVDVQNKKSVVYWIHGGGYRYGGIQQHVYYGAALAALGDVVVVTVNYRVGAFGFLTTGTDDAPGNIGLWDILEGLKFVKENIIAFGGDPSNITIAGEGAGSDAVGLLSVSPLAKDLFRRQIMLSGSPAYLDDYNGQINQAISQKIAEGVGCADANNTITNNATGVLFCLRHTPPSKISEVHSTIKPHSMNTFVSQFGDDLLPTSPRKSIIAENMKCKEVLIGNVRDEGSYLLTTADPDTYGFFGQRYPIIGREAGEKMIREIFQNFPDSDEVVKQYINSSLTDVDYKIIRRQVYTSVGDVSIRCPTAYYAEKCADGGGDVYYYNFLQRPSSSPWAPWMGVAHGSMVDFVFGQPLFHRHTYTRNEILLSVEVIEIISNFAKYGKPNIPWPLYSKSKPDLVNIGPGPGLKGNGTGPHRRHCDFFRPFFGF